MYANCLMPQLAAGSISGNNGESRPWSWLIKTNIGIPRLFELRLFHFHLKSGQTHVDSRQTDGQDFPFETLKVILSSNKNNITTFALTQPSPYISPVRGTEFTIPFTGQREATLATTENKDKQLF